ncbi:monovalent cation/H+ antiporter complex subunit F [Brachybacterium sp. AOP25-B2-12]|uniref:monovalent cation/H+ antiporter complex subunit F n=1 Tax=Brachybacterium sp. AOP25-B2-12 TaxID=3457710 RepID=UPI00403370C3
MTFELGILVVAAILAVAAVPVVYRIIVGPTILDRAVASDMLVVITVMCFGLYSAFHRTTYAGTAMLSLTALAFLATVAVARFVSREDPGAGGASRPSRQESEGHSAVHAEGPAVGDDAAAADVPGSTAEERTSGTQKPAEPGGGRGDH